MEYEELFVLNEFSEIIKYHNTALDRIKRFREAYPYLIAPNLFDTLQHNLRDNITILFREMSGMKDQKNKQYEKKYVCRICNGVYMMSLPSGVCDECRGRYGENVMKMIKPENNGKKTSGDTPTPTDSG